MPGPASTPRRRLPPDQRRELIEIAAAEVFAERGYRSASVEEIAKRSGISVPVLYDHFASKRDLHRHLLEKHFAELRALWAERLGVLGGKQGQRIRDAIDAWFAYVEGHPYASRMLFADTSGDPEIGAMHREVFDKSRSALLPVLAQEVHLDSNKDEVVVEMLWEGVRGVLQGLARWWSENPTVPRQQVVDAAVTTLWTGLGHIGKRHSS